METLAGAIAAMPLVDHHAHNVWRWELSQAAPWPTFFSETDHPETLEEHTPSSLFYLRSLRDLGRLYHCQPTRQAVEETRTRLGEAEVTGTCLRAANLSHLLLDDGLTPDLCHPWDWHSQWVHVSRVLRIERLAEECLAECPDFASFAETFRSRLQAQSRACKGLKSIAAYRTGLRLESADRERLADIYRDLRSQPRLCQPDLVAWIFEEALQLAQLTGCPLQIHTGFGDRDLDLALSNPVHLRPWLDRYPAAPVVLLHAGYPYFREAGYLASIYPRVYVDAGLAVPFLSVAGMRACWQGLLELAPTSKILLSSDASRIADLFYLGAHWGRVSLAQALEQAVADGDLSYAQAEAVASGIMSRNARAIYQL